jgi:hypothetical protein
MQLAEKVTIWLLLTKGTKFSAIFAEKSLLTKCDPWPKHPDF